MKQIESTLSSAVGSYQRRHGGEMPRGACLHDPIEHRTPADELMEKEDRAGMREPATMPLFAGMNGDRKTPFEELGEFEERAAAESREVVLMKLEAVFWLLDFIFSDGPHPGKVMRRLYALAKKYRPEAIWDMGYRNIGKLFDESGAAMEWRVGQMIDGYARSHGLTAVRMPWQRTEEACGAYSESHMGNSSRGGGEKSAKHKHRAKGKKGSKS